MFLLWKLGGDMFVGGVNNTRAGARGAGRDACLHFARLSNDSTALKNVTHNERGGPESRRFSSVIPLTARYLGLRSRLTI